MQVKGIAQPVAVYAVVGLKRDAQEATTAHLQLKLDADRMSDDERKAAADALRHALELLEKRRPGQPLSDLPRVGSWHLAHSSL